jgi:hypothetical protein
MSDRAALVKEWIAETADKWDREPTFETWLCQKMSKLEAKLEEAERKSEDLSHLLDAAVSSTSRWRRVARRDASHLLEIRHTFNELQAVATDGEPQISR